jgi:hypothetical protein
VHISSEKRQESSSGNFRATGGKAERKEDVEVTSREMAEVPTDDAIAKHLEAEGVSPHCRTKAYMVKLFSKLEEAERWELQEDLMNSLMK